ncbi:hypothetical protein [Phaffia rhodozyma]|uniref:Uncharacterized protein n=1 Tax=Phaffia rhodozyma TaxID=264483 RepID=A0A0F7SHF4_PHARH|nr:hypothetical protein [Phaffia rhodozyma]
MVIIRKQKKTSNTISKSVRRTELSVMALHSNRSQEAGRKMFLSLQSGATLLYFVSFW